MRVVACMGARMSRAVDHSRAGGRKSWVMISSAWEAGAAWMSRDVRLWEPDAVGGADVDGRAGRSRADAKHAARSACAGLAAPASGLLMSPRVLPAPESKLELWVGSIPKCQVVTLLVCPWRQGTPPAAVIATMKFSHSIALHGGECQPRENPQDWGPNRANRLFASVRK